MTDAEAKRDLERAIKWGMFGSPPTVEALRHALTALDDPVVLVNTHDAGRFGDMNGAVATARRHMEGK